MVTSTQPLPILQHSTEQPVKSKTSFFTALRQSMGDKDGPSSSRLNHEISPFYQNFPPATKKLILDKNDLPIPTSRTTANIGQIYHSVLKQHQKARNASPRKPSTPIHTTNDESIIKRIYSDNRTWRKRKCQELENDVTTTTRITLNQPNGFKERTASEDSFWMTNAHGITESPQNGSPEPNHSNSADSPMLQQSQYPFLQENALRHQHIRHSMVAFLVARQKRLRTYESDLRTARIAHETAWYHRLKTADAKLRELVRAEHFAQVPSPSPVTSPIIGTGSNAKYSGGGNGVIGNVQGQGYSTFHRGRGTAPSPVVMPYTSRDPLGAYLHDQHAPGSPNPTNGVYSRRRGAATASDVVRTEAEFIEIMERLEQEASRGGQPLQPFPARPPMDELVADIPDMHLDPWELHVQNYQDRNGRVHDPVGLLKSTQAHWTESETSIFVQRFHEFGKDFAKIKTYLSNKTEGQCVHFYYLRKHDLGLTSNAKKVGKEAGASGNPGGTRRKMLQGKKRSIEDLRNTRSPVSGEGISNTASPRPDAERKRRPSRKKEREPTERDDEQKPSPAAIGDVPQENSVPKAGKMDLKVHSRTEHEAQTTTTRKYPKSPLPKSPSPANHVHSKESHSHGNSHHSSNQTHSQLSKHGYHSVRSKRRSQSVSSKDSHHQISRATASATAVSSLHTTSSGVSLPPIPIRIPAGIPPPPPALMSAPAVAAAAAAVATASKVNPLYAMPIPTALPPQLPIGAPPLIRHPPHKIDTRPHFNPERSKFGPCKSAVLTSPKLQQLSAPVTASTGSSTSTTSRTGSQHGEGSNKKHKKSNHGGDFSVFPGAIAAAPVPVNAGMRNGNSQRFDATTGGVSGTTNSNVYDGRQQAPPTSTSATSSIDDSSVKRSIPGTPQPRQSIAVSDIPPLRAVHVHQPGTPRDLRVLKSPRKQPATLSPRLTLKAPNPPGSAPPQMIVTIPVPSSTMLNSSVIAVQRGHDGRGKEVGKLSKGANVEQAASPVVSSLTGSKGLPPAPVLSAPVKDAPYPSSTSNSRSQQRDEGPKSAIPLGANKWQDSNSPDLPTLYPFLQPGSAVSTGSNDSVIKVMPQRKVSSIGSLLNDTPPSSDSSTTEEDEYPMGASTTDGSTRANNGQSSASKPPFKVILNRPTPAPSVSKHSSPQNRNMSYPQSHSRTLDQKPVSATADSQSIYDDTSILTRFPQRDRFKKGLNTSVPSLAGERGFRSLVGGIGGDQGTDGLHVSLPAMMPMPALLAGRPDPYRRQSDASAIPPPPVPALALPPLPTFIRKPGPSSMYPLGGFFEEGGVIVGRGEEQHPSEVSRIPETSPIAGETQSAATAETNGKVNVSHLVSWSREENSDTE